MGRSYTSKRGEAVPFEFELDGVPFVCRGGIMLLDLCEAAKNADLDADSPEGAAALADIFHTALGPDYAQFTAHCRRRTADGDEVPLMDIFTDLVQHVVGHPLARSGPSSAGPTPTGGTSTVVLPPVQELTDEQIAAWRAGVQQAATPSPG